MGLRPCSPCPLPSPRYVCIAMEALDQLLMACHCQSINLFVESFLKMVAKLLESEKPNLQILGTNSVRSSAGGRRRRRFAAPLPGFQPCLASLRPWDGDEGMWVRV